MLRQQQRNAANASVPVPLSIQRTFRTGHIIMLLTHVLNKLLLLPGPEVASAWPVLRGGRLPRCSYALLPTNARLQASSALAMVSAGFPHAVTSMGLTALKNHWRDSSATAQCLLLPSCLFSAMAFCHRLCRGGTELVFLPGERLVP